MKGATPITIFIFLAVASVIFISFNLLSPEIRQENYIDEKTLNELQKTGEQYVTDAKPSGLAGTGFFLVSSFISMLKFMFTVVANGIGNLINAISTTLGIPEIITKILGGIVVFWLAYETIKGIAGIIRR